MRPMTSGERDADFSEGNAPLVGVSVDTAGTVVAFCVVVALLVDLAVVVVSVRGVLIVDDAVGDGRGTIVPLTFCCVPRKLTRTFMFVR